MAAPKDVRDEEDYDNELQSAGNKLVVVDFHASWCGPCVRMHPVVNELTLKYPTVVFLKVDVDECGEVAAKENVTSMPTFLLYKNKIQVDVIKGANAAALEAAIKKHMSVGGEGEGSSVPGQTRESAPGELRPRTANQKSFTLESPTATRDSSHSPPPKRAKNNKVIAKLSPRQPLPKKTVSEQAVAAEETDKKPELGEVGEADKKTAVLDPGKVKTILLRAQESGIKQKKPKTSASPKKTGSNEVVGGLETHKKTLLWEAGNVKTYLPRAQEAEIGEKKPKTSASQKKTGSSEVVSGVETGNKTLFWEAVNVKASLPTTGEEFGVGRRILPSLRSAGEEQSKMGGVQGRKPVSSEAKSESVQQSRSSGRGGAGPGLNWCGCCRPMDERGSIHGMPEDILYTTEWKTTNAPRDSRSKDTSKNSRRKEGKISFAKRGGEVQLMEWTNRGGEVQQMEWTNRGGEVQQMEWTNRGGDSKGKMSKSNNSVSQSKEGQPLKEEKVGRGGGGVCSCCGGGEQAKKSVHYSLEEKTKVRGEQESEARSESVQRLRSSGRGGAGPGLNWCGCCRPMDERGSIHGMPEDILYTTEWKTTNAPRDSRSKDTSKNSRRKEGKISFAKRGGEVQQMQWANRGGDSKGKMSKSSISMSKSKEGRPPQFQEGKPLMEERVGRGGGGVCSCCGGGGGQKEESREGKSVHSMEEKTKVKGEQESEDATSNVTVGKKGKGKESKSDDPPPKMSVDGTKVGGGSTERLKEGKKKGQRGKAVEGKEWKAKRRESDDEEKQRRESYPKESVSESKSKDENSKEGKSKDEKDASKKQTTPIASPPLKGEPDVVEGSPGGLVSEKEGKEKIAASKGDVEAKVAEQAAGRVGPRESDAAENGAKKRLKSAATPSLPSTSEFHLKSNPDIAADQKSPDISPRSSLVSRGRKSSVPVASTPVVADGRTVGKTSGYPAQKDVESTITPNTLDEIKIELRIPADVLKSMMEDAEPVESLDRKLLLNTMLMKSDCECLNEADDHPMLSCIDPEKYSEEGSYLESDCDAELIMNLSFSVNVKIHSLVIEGPVSNGPKTIKIFTNQTKTMDFDNAKTTEPVQQIIVTPENLNGEPIPLRFVKFQNVGNFQVFIQDNQEGLDTTVIKKFQLYGHPISTTNMSDFKRIAGKKGEAH
ncbi:unnamed protein product [Cyprideis torosa]|uniref:Uncharacterized protein n=1 Tax=Cyprideis torosa TaxID=163714 RepID=A0A7R8WIB8_9CRUS|nr:unnamed protein product [Cyprideis torosa]CAG0898602.1 unnamed protein product [Cyprideis torosa]